MQASINIWQSDFQMVLVNFKIFKCSVWISQLAISLYVSSILKSRDSQKKLLLDT